MICNSCTARLLAGLERLPILYGDAELLLANLPGTAGVERVSGSRSYGIALDDVLVDTRSLVLTCLASWAGLVVDGRGGPAPDREVRHLAAFLARHLDWLAVHPAATDLVGEIDAIVAGTEGVLQNRQQRQLNLGSCIAPGCVGEIDAVDGGGTDGWRVRCAAGHEWGPDGWLALGTDLRRRADDADPPSGGHRRRTLPTRLAAKTAGVSEATVRKWASRGRLTRYGSPGRAEYDVEELAALVHRPD